MISRSNSATPAIMVKTIRPIGVFLPMPYRAGAALVVRAAAAVAGTLTLHTTPWPIASDRWRHLHARHIDEHPVAARESIVLVERAGRGHLVGLCLATTGPEGPPRWLEGDERVYIDGELVAHGTGTEDFFGAGWYGVPGRLDGPGTQALQGFPIYEEVDKTIRTASYRWLLADASPWEESVRIELEHGPDGEVEVDDSGLAWGYEARP
jgi:hypothetical protein